jgi:uncharacterized protein YdeI (YjbR/CyaY-like superfamily)
MIQFFKTQKDWRKWLEKNHDRADELIVGFYKVDCGKPSITWKESVDEALCFGWIDGVRKRIDEERYQIRFTPRRPTSIWSAINIARVKELTELGLMHEAGLAAFAKRRDDKSAVYAYEQRKNPELSKEDLKKLKGNKKAWAFFSKTPPSYQKLAFFWIISAKREETRQKRLNQLIADSAAGRKIGPAVPSKK